MFNLFKNNAVIPTAIQNTKTPTEWTSHKGRWWKKDVITAVRCENSCSTMETQCLKIFHFFTEVFYCYFFLKKMYYMLPFIVHVIEMWSSAVLLVSLFKVNLLIITPSALANIREMCRLFIQNMNTSAVRVWCMTSGKSGSICKKNQAENTIYLLFQEFFFLFFFLNHSKAWWGLQFSTRDYKTCMIGSLSLIMLRGVARRSSFSFFIRKHISL